MGGRENWCEVESNNFEREHWWEVESNNFGRERDKQGVRQGARQG